MPAKYPPLSPAFKFIRLISLLLFSPLPKKISGPENLPKSGSMVIAANHSSLLDGYLLVLYLSRRVGTYIHFMTKDKYFANPLAGLLLKTSAAIKVDLNDPKASFLIALKCLEKGQLIGIFPEGTRSPDGRIQRGKPGAAALALRSKAPLIPVGLVGTKDILPRGSIWPRIVPFKINIGSPIDLAAYYQKYDQAGAEGRAEGSSKIEEEVTRELMKAIAGLSDQEYPY